MKTETSQHPIIGFREWRWDAKRERLTGPYSESPWEPGTTIASCGLRGHDAPDPDCSCGLYADPRPPSSEHLLDDLLDHLLDRIADGARELAPAAGDLLKDLLGQARIADARQLAPEAGDVLKDLLGRAWASCFEERKRTVIGAVVLEGRVCVHASGLRGARARIVALAHEPTQRAPVSEIAALYGAQSVPTGELLHAALEFGVELRRGRTVSTG